MKGRLVMLKTKAELEADPPPSMCTWTSES
jgi:hypothetical protein